MATPTIFDSTLTNPGGTGSTITVTLPTHAVGDIIYISIGNTGNTLWTGNPAGWNRISQQQVGTATNGLLGTWFWRKIVSGDSLPLASPVFTLGATVTRMAIARTIRGADLESPFSLSEWNARAYNTGTANPVRPTSITTFPPETLTLHDYFQRAATNAPDPSGYTQDEEIVISGTLVGNASEKNVANQTTTLSNQDASPTSGVRWVAGIVAVPSPDYVYYRAGSQALTASGTSATPTVPTGTSSLDNRGNKDLIVATIEAAGTPTISPQVGADWTQITDWNTTTSGNGTTVRKYWALYDGSINTQFNRSTTGEIFVYLSTYRNTKQTSPIGAVATQQNASSSTSTFPSLIRSATKVTVQITCVADATPTFTSPSPWVERNDSNGVTCADQAFNATGSVSSGSFSLSAAGPTVAGTMEIKSVSSVGEVSRSASVDVSATITTSATFFSVFSRTTSVDASAGITATGVRIVSRSVAVGVTADIASAGTGSTPTTTFERSASLDVSGSIEIAGTSFTIFERVSVVTASGDIASSAAFFTTLERSVSTDALGSVSTSGSFFSVAQGSALVDASGLIASSAEFFTTFLRSVSVETTGTIDSSGAFFSTLAASAEIATTAGIATSSEFFSTLESASLVNCGVDISSAGEVQSGANTLERSASLDAVAALNASGMFWSTTDRSVAINVTGMIQASGQGDLSRSASFNVTASVIVAGGGADIQFHPHGRGRVGRENRILSIGEENRRL